MFFFSKKLLLTLSHSVAFSNLAYLLKKIQKKKNLRSILNHLPLV